MPISEFEKNVYDKLREVPRGKVLSYKELARAIGRPKAYRAVGSALNKNPCAPAVPCHRVVKSDGNIGGYAQGAKKKTKLLMKEGVVIERGKIPKKHFYNF